MDYLKKHLRNPKTGELHKVVQSLCSVKRIDPSVLHDKYESKMEEMNSKFAGQTKMKAKYDLYCKKRLAVI